MSGRDHIYGSGFAFCPHAVDELPVCPMFFSCLLDHYESISEPHPLLPEECFRHCSTTQTVRKQLLAYAVAVWVIVVFLNILGAALRQGFLIPLLGEVTGRP